MRAITPNRKSGFFSEFFSDSAAMIREGYRSSFYSERGTALKSPIELSSHVTRDWTKRRGWLSDRLSPAMIPQYMGRLWRVRNVLGDGKREIDSPCVHWETEFHRRHKFNRTCERAKTWYSRESEMAFRLVEQRSRFNRTKWFSLQGPIARASLHWIISDRDVQINRVCRDGDERFCRCLIVRRVGFVGLRSYRARRVRGKVLKSQTATVMYIDDEKKSLSLSRSIDAFLTSADKVLNHERNICCPLVWRRISKEQFSDDSLADWSFSYYTKDVL